MTAKTESPVLREVETFIAKYATLANDYYLLPLVLWATATHTWPSFDCFPYLVITAYVKRAGKTRLMELMAMLSSNGRTFSPDSPASMFRALADEKPTIFIDEAEKLNQETHPAREFLNKGYKRGQTISRFVGGEVTDFECYCPKSFVLIGDVYDTLRDRCIVITMRRRNPIEAAQENKFRRALVEPEAGALREKIHQLVEEHQAEIDNTYTQMGGLSFLNDRDEELWSPLFALAMALCPSRVDELVKAAVDISTEKTSVRHSFKDLLDVEEKKADDLEAQIILLRDILALLDNERYVTSANLIERLKQIPTSPWRKYRGTGLTSQDAGFLLSALGLHTKPIRVKSGKVTEKAVLRGYTRIDLMAAAKLVGLR